MNKLVTKLTLANEARKENSNILSFQGNKFNTLIRIAHCAIHKMIN